jgi:hypothetical protein
MQRRQFLLATGTIATGLPELARAAGQTQTPEFNALKPHLEDPAQGWQSLFNGKDLDEWKPLQDPGRAAKPFDWQIATDVRLDPRDPTTLSHKHDAGSRNAPAFVNNRAGKSDNPITKKNYADIELYLESMIAKESNSGICVMGLYEISMRDSYGHTELKYGDNGGIYAPVINEKRVGGEPPMVNASRPPGEWESFHLWFRAPRFNAGGHKVENARLLRVELNGQRVHEDFELPKSTRGWSPWDEKPRAPLLLQGDHGPVAFRNVYIRTLLTT